MSSPSHPGQSSPSTPTGSSADPDQRSDSDAAPGLTVNPSLTVNPPTTPTGALLADDSDTGLLTEPDSATASEPPSGSKRRSAKAATHRWARWLHVYTSMIALIIVLFFGITGITLNHPSWTFGDSASNEISGGTLQVDPLLEDGSVNWLPIAESIRAEYDVTGEVNDFGVNAGKGSILFTNPGYSATLFFDTQTGVFELTVHQEGFVAVMNDLHKGRDSGSGWAWVIDVSAGFLVAISLTGLTMQLFLRKRRRSAFISVAIGGVISVAAIWLTLL